MSVAKDVSITFTGCTPNPVNVASTYLMQVGATEVNHTWGEYANVTWGSLASTPWGSPSA